MAKLKAGFSGSSLFDLFQKFVAISGETHARLRYDLQGFFLPVRGDQQFRIRELKFYKISCDVHVRVFEDLLCEKIHEGVSLPLNHKPCLIFLKLEYLDIHSPDN